MSYNIPIFLVSLFKTYLSNHSQQVLVDCYCSLKYRILSNVPTESRLGPLLFILYINDNSTISLSNTYSFALYRKYILVSYYKIFLSFSLLSLLFSLLHSRHLTINKSNGKFMIILKNLSLIFLTIFLKQSH